MPSESTESSHRHHHHNKSEPTTHEKPNATTDDKSTTAGGADSISMSTATISSTIAPVNPTVIKGAWRLLRLLPRETRHIVSRMLELDPARRASIDEVTADAWIARSAFCRQEVAGRVLCAEGHQHVLATSDENGDVKISKRPDQDCEPA